MHRTAQTALATALLFCGCMIYLAWRSSDIILVKWTYSLGLGAFTDAFRSGVGHLRPGDFVVYSLPDALYCIAYVLIMDSMWRNSRIAVRASMCLLLPAAVVAHELMQLAGWLPGTFDIIDLACYLAVAAAYIAYLFLLTHYKPQNSTR